MTDQDQPLTDDEREAARLAGWDFTQGDPPADHTLPPAIDPDLGHNGIPPTDAEQVA